MAGIDKTYTDSYNDYKEFKDWADNQTLTFFNGHKVCIGDWVWDYEKKDFDNGEIPIMNTPTWLDIYLIQNCESEFVIERMKSVYGKYFEKYQKVANLTKIPEGYSQNRKIIISNGINCKFPFKKKMFKKPIGGKTKWWLQSNNKFWYNSDTKTWVGRDAFYPHDTNTAHISSIKSLVRHLRKQYLPKGITFSLTGRYVGENYIITIN